MCVCRLFTHLAALNLLKRPRLHLREHVSHGLILILACLRARHHTTSEGFHDPLLIVSILPCDYLIQCKDGCGLLCLTLLRFAFLLGKSRGLLLRGQRLNLRVDLRQLVYRWRCGCADERLVLLVLVLLRWHGFILLCDTVIVSSEGYWTRFPA